MSYKERFAKSIRKLERRFIPNLREYKLYGIIRTTMLIPVLLVLALLDSFPAQKEKQNTDRKKLVLSNIIAGWSNLAFPSPEIEALAKKRAAVCASCPFATFVDGLHTVVVDNKTQNIRGLKCSKCGCPLSAKVRSPHDSCPQGKW